MAEVIQAGGGLHKNSIIKRLILCATLVNLHKIFCKTTRKILIPVQLIDNKLRKMEKVDKGGLSRRKFIGKTAAGVAGVGAIMKTGQSAASYQRIIGSNDRINIGFLGCGARSAGHR